MPSHLHLSFIVIEFAVVTCNPENLGTFWVDGVLLTIAIGALGGVGVGKQKMLHYSHALLKIPICIARMQLCNSRSHNLKFKTA
jgi:hypothetical protein